MSRKPGISEILRRLLPEEHRTVQRSETPSRISRPANLANAFPLSWSHYILLVRCSRSGETRLRKPIRHAVQFPRSEINESPGFLRERPDTRHAAPEGPATLWRMRVKHSDPIDKARTLPAGAVFHRCALQVNPHDYAGTFRGKAAGGDADAHAKAIIDKAAEIGVSVIAVTDHNNVSGVAAFQSAAAPHGIDVFPGFELSSNEGVHVLCIYPQDSDSQKLERFLGEFGIRNTAPSSDLANMGLVDILRHVREQGGVAIAAHVTNDGGLLKVLTGRPRIQAWQANDLLAIQIPGPVGDLPQDVRQIVENKNPDYCRTHAADDGLAVAVLNARDLVKPEDMEDRSATCWDQDVRGQHRGFAAGVPRPGSRIRLNPKEGKLEPEEHAELVALAWEGGFLDEAAIHFNSNLNVLVGGRGTGKSDGGREHSICSGSRRDWR